MSLAPSSASFSTADLTLAKPEPSTVFSAGTIGIVASNMSPSRNSGSRSVYCRDALIRFRSPLPSCSAMPVCTNTLAIIGFFGIGVNSPSFIRPSKNEREALTVRMDSLSMVTRATTGLEYSRCMRLFATNSRAIIVRGLTRLSPFNTKRSGRFRSVNSRSCSYESNKLVLVSVNIVSPNHGISNIRWANRGNDFILAQEQHCSKIKALFAGRVITIV